LQRNARAWGKQLSQTYEFAYRRRYGLTLIDQRFLDATHEDIVLDYWAHRFVEDPKLAIEEVFNDDFAADLAEMEAAAAAGEWETFAADDFGAKR
jgi:hypothetical protein